MKKKLAIVVLLGFTFLFGCNAVNNNVGASNESEFYTVLKQDLGRGNAYKVKHKDTGCYYILTESYQFGGGITQMYTKEGLPYCD